MYASINPCHLSFNLQVGQTQLSALPCTPGYSPLQGGLGLSTLAAQFDLLYPILPPPSSFHRSLSLINILHLKLSLSVCFWKTQSATEGGRDRTKGIGSLAQQLQLSWAPLMPTPSEGVWFPPTLSPDPGAAHPPGLFHSPLFPVGVN